MQLIKLPAPDLQIRATDQYVERSPTLHLSDILHDLLRRKGPKRFGGEANWGNFYAGLIFERLLEDAWINREMGVRPELIRPGEVSLNGITGTPDAFDTLVGCPEEYKFTKLSCRQHILDIKFWHYLVQLKAYCKITGTTTGTLWVCHVMGNWSHDDADPLSGYVFNGWRFNWDQLEIDENWQMLVGHGRRHMGLAA
jgi:hypothetical protein